MTLYTSTFPTRFGPFSVAVDECGGVVGCAFGNLAALRPRLRSRLTSAMPNTDARTPSDPSLIVSASRTARVRRQVLEYCAGHRRHFELKFTPAGTPFQQRVWAALQHIPYGSTCSYRALADEVQSSPRAVGNANAANPICLLVPCHRVIGTNGSLTGFAFGMRTKRDLLVHEGARCHRAT